MAAPRKVLVIMNPVAGHGKAKKMFPLVERKLVQSGISFDVIETERPGHATELAAMASRTGYDVLAAMGGDGTLGEVVNGFMRAREAGSKTSVKIAVIPSGTGNDFVGGSRLFCDWEEAIDALADPEVRDMDVLKLRDSAGFTRFVVNSVGIGYDAYVVKRVAEMGSRKMGYLGYMFEALRGLLFFNPGTVSVSFDGASEVVYHRTWIFAITNSEKFGGGMTVCPGALPDDGLLDVAFLHGIPRKDLVALVFLVRGGKHIGRPGVDRLNASKVTLSAPDGFPCHVDGDTVDARFPITVQALHGVIPFVVRSR